MLRATALIAGLVLTLAASPALGQERLTLPGSRLSLALPEGFAVAEEFSGYTNATLPMDIVIGATPEGREEQTWIELSAAFGDLEIANALFPEPGMVFTEQETIVTEEGRELAVIHGTKPVAGKAPLERWMVLVGPEAVSTVTIHLVNGSVEAEAIREIIRTLVVGGELTLADQLAALPFAIDAVEPLTTHTIIAGKLLVVSPGLYTVTNPLDPIVLVVWNRVVHNPTAAEVAEEMMRGAPDLEDAVIEERATAPFAGVEGIRLSGTFVRRGVSSHFVHYNAVVNGWHVGMLATSAEQYWDLMSPVAETMAASVRQQ
jgi:hypothetical protein